MAIRRFRALLRLGGIAMLAACPGSVCSALPPPPPGATPPRFTITVREEPVSTILREMFKGAGKDFIIDPDVASRVTVDIRRVTFGQALAAVLAAARPPVVALPEKVGTGTGYHVRLVTPPDLSPPPETEGAYDLGRPGPAPAPPSPHVGLRLTAARAVRAAQAFCRKIGQPVTAPGAAVFPVPPGLTTPPAYWQPCWQVTFPQQATVQVVDATGVIALYRDETPRHDRGVVVQADGLLLMTMTMPRAEALRRARSAMAATGQPEFARFLGAGADLEAWSVDWEREAHGVPYGDEDGAVYERAGAMVDAHTGKVLWLRYDYPSPPFMGDVGKVTQAQAIQAAKADVDAAAAAPGATCESANLRIVCPETGPLRQSHAVWIVNVLDGPAPSRSFHEVWVDSATGHVIRNKRRGFPGHFSWAPGHGVLRNEPVRREPCVGSGTACGPTRRGTGQTRRECQESCRQPAPAVPAVELER